MSTIRMMLSIMLSCINYNHPLSAQAVLGVIVVFDALPCVCMVDIAQNHLQGELFVSRQCCQKRMLIDLVNNCRLLLGDGVEFFQRHSFNLSVKFCTVEDC